MAFQLFVIAGPDQGRIFDLPPGPALIGRTREADVCLKDPRVSRRQCIIEVDGATVDLVDLDSSRGTFVNAKPIEGIVSLRPEDEIRMGETSLFLVLQDEAANTTIREEASDTHSD